MCFIHLHNREDFATHYNQHKDLGWYYSEYIDKVEDLRVHVAHGKVLGILQRPKPQDTNKYIWNSSTTNIPPKYLESSEWNIDVVKTAIKALNAIGMDFSGIDILVDKNGKVYVLELNTLPNAKRSPTVYKRYIEYFDWLFSSDEKRPHFNINSNDPNDYAWEIDNSKKLTILVKNNNFHISPKLIYPKLQTPNAEFIVAGKDQDILPHIDLNDRIFIRWGSSYKTDKIENSITYNTQTFSNKIARRKELAKAGINTPRLLTPNDTNTNYPIVARPRTHSRGKNFIVLENEKDFRTHYNDHKELGWYYSEYIDKVQEFRVNVAHGKILSVLENFKGDHKYSWNRHQSGKLPKLLTPEESNIEVVRTAINAGKAIGFDFAGVDIIIGKDGKIYVLEINTMPGMTSTVHTQEMYVKYFDWLASSNTKIPHFNIQSNNIKDYFF